MKRSLVPVLLGAAFLGAVTIGSTNAADAQPSPVKPALVEVTSAAPQEHGPAGVRTATSTAPVYGPYVVPLPVSSWEHGMPSAMKTVANGGKALCHNRSC